MLSLSSFGPALAHVSAPVSKAINMPGMGEWMIILFIVLVVFGPAKLPQIGDALGKSIRGFKKAVSSNDEIDVTPTSTGPSGQIAEGSQPLHRSASEEQASRRV